MTYSEQLIAAIQNGDLDSVDELLELALQVDEEEMLHLLGNTLYQLGFLNETRKVYNHLLEVNPEDDELKVFLAEIEIEDGNEIDALELLQDIDQMSPSYPQSLIVQADYYHVNELPEVSIQKLEEAEELLPDEPVIKFALAEVYYSMADYKNAIVYYEPLAVEGIDEIGGIILSGRLGDSFLMTGVYGQALKYLEEALTFKDKPEVYYNLGFAHLQLESYDKAIKALEQAQEMDPSLTAVYLLLSTAYENQQKLDQALDVIEKGIMMNEINTELYLRAAQLTEKLHDHDKTKQYFEKALNNEPEDERVIIKYGEFLYYNEDYDSLLALFAASPASVMDNPEAKWMVASAHNDNEDFEKARALFDEAYLYLANDLDFLHDYIFFLREDGQRDKMKVMAQKYMDLNPEYDPAIASILQEDTFY